MTSREDFLAAGAAPELHAFESRVWLRDGKPQVLHFIRARVKDKAKAKQRATVPGPRGDRLDNERFEAALVVQCARKEDGSRLLQDGDEDQVMELDAGEVNRFCMEIIGRGESGDPSKP